MIYTTHAVLHKIITQLKTQYPFEEAQSIAWELIRHVTQKSRIELLVKKVNLSAEQVAHLDTLVIQHLEKHVPIAYLTCEVLFGDLTFTIRPPILIPRSETEAWCYELIERLEPVAHEPLKILDLCTGSGCIALALAYELPNATVIGVDINPEAIALAEENRNTLGIDNATFIKSDLFDTLQEQTFDIIVANPPYIGLHEQESLAPSVRTFESPIALFAEKDGLAVIERIVTNATQFIHPNAALAQLSVPQLLIEIGSRQAEAVKALMETHKYDTITLWKDYQGHNRVACARVPVYVTKTKDHR